MTLIFRLSSAFMGIIAVSSLQYVPIKPLVCSNGPGTLWVRNVPRLSFSAIPVSSDLGSIPWFSCKANKTCTTEHIEDSFNDFVKASGVTAAVSLLLHPSLGSPLAYLEGLASISIVNVVIAILLPLLTAACICGRYCWCCCANRPNACICLRCGASYPTKPTRCACGCGIIDLGVARQPGRDRGRGWPNVPKEGGKKRASKIVLRNASDAAESVNEAREWGYPILSRACSFIFVSLSVVIAVWLASTAHVQGGAAISKGLVALSDNSLIAGFGHSAAGLFSGLLEPLGELVIAMSADVGVPLIVNFNRSIDEALQPAVLRVGLLCLTATLSDTTLIPDFGVATAFLNGTAIRLDAIRGNVSMIRVSLDSLDGVQADIQRNAGVLNTRLDSVSSSLFGIYTALNATEVAIGNVTLLRSTMLAMLGSVRADIAAFSTSYPSTAQFRGTAGDPDISVLGTVGNEDLNNLLSNSLEGDNPATNRLAEKLSALVAQLTSSPDTSRTAAILDLLNATVVEAQGPDGVVMGLNNSFSMLENAAGGLPRASTLETPINNIVSAAGRVPSALKDVLTALIAIQGYIGELPGLRDLYAELDKGGPLVSLILSCLPNFVAIRDSVNATLIRLPPPSGHPLWQYSEMSYINDTAWDILDGLTGVRKDLQDANNTMATAVDIKKYMADILDANASVTNSLAELNVESLRKELNNLDNSTSGIDLSAVRQTLSDLSSALSSARIDGKYARDLRNASIERANLVGNLTFEAEDFDRLANGFCSSDGYRACTNSAACSGGVCAGIARRRCWIGTGAQGGAEQHTVCSENSDCTTSHGASARCLGARSRSYIMKVLLSNSGATFPNTTEALRDVDKAKANTESSDPSAPSSRGALDSARSSMDALRIDVYKSDLSRLSSSLNSSFDIGDVRKALSDVDKSMNDTDISSYRIQVEDARSGLDSYFGIDGLPRRGLRAILSFLDNWIVFVTATSRPLLANMSRAALASAKDQFGLGGLLRALASAADELASAGFDTLVPLEEWLARPTSFHATDMAAVAAGWADRVNGYGNFADNRHHGALHYVLVSAFPDMLVASNDSSAWSIFTDMSGVGYPGGRLCVTAPCLRVTADVLSTSPLSMLPSAFPQLGLSAGALPIQLSREQLMMVPWIIPLFVAALGMCGLLAPVIICCRDPRWQKLPTSCMVGVAICQLPIILLVTAVTFPLLLGASDVCGTGHNVAYRYVIDSGDALCTTMPGGLTHGILTACNVTASTSLALLGSPPVNIHVAATLNMPAATAALLGECPIALGPSDPIWPIFKSVAASIIDVPYRAARSVLDSPVLVESGFQFEAGLREPILTASNATGLVAARFVISLGQTALTCTNLKEFLDEMRSFVCCTLVGPVAWYVGAWYLMAWALFCCAVPAGCCGRKRLPTRPWGPSYEALRGEKETHGACCGLLTSHIKDDEESPAKPVVRIPDKKIAANLASVGKKGKGNQISRSSTLGKEKGAATSSRNLVTERKLTPADCINSSSKRGMQRRSSSDMSDPAEAVVDVQDVSLNVMAQKSAVKGRKHHQDGLSPASAQMLSLRSVGRPSTGIALGATASQKHQQDPYDGSSFVDGCSFGFDAGRGSLSPQMGVGSSARPGALSVDPIRPARPQRKLSTATTAFAPLGTELPLYMDAASFNRHQVQGSDETPNPLGGKASREVHRERKSGLRGLQ